MDELQEHQGTIISMEPGLAYIGGIPAATQDSMQPTGFVISDELIQLCAVCHHIKRSGTSISYLPVSKDGGRRYPVPDAFYCSCEVKDD